MPSRLAQMSLVSHTFATGEVREPVSLERPSVTVEAGESAPFAMDEGLFRSDGWVLVGKIAHFGKFGFDKKRQKCVCSLY